VIVIALWMLTKILPTPEPRPPKYASYSVSGPSTSGTAAVTFRNESGGTEQKTVNLPWMLTVEVKHGTFLSVIAQKEGKAGTIRAEIRADGRVIQEAESDTAYGIASASGRVP
jgi:hypothetical protein